MAITILAQIPPREREVLGGGREVMGVDSKTAEHRVSPQSLSAG